MKPLFLLFAFVSVFAGCVASPKPVADLIPGTYSMIAGGFNESLSVLLRPDFTYAMDHELIACDLSEGSRHREGGLWKFTDGLVVLEPRARTPNFPDQQVFAPAAFRRLQPKKGGRDFYLVNPDFPKNCILQKSKSEANQRPEPTSGLRPDAAQH